MKITTLADYPIIQGQSIQPMGDWISSLVNAATQIGTAYATSQFTQTPQTPQTITSTGGFNSGYTAIGNGKYINAAGQIIDTNNLGTVTGSNANNANTYPTWLLPVGIGAGILLIVLLTRK